jgi:hypothetical protein
MQPKPGLRGVIDFDDDEVYGELLSGLFPALSNSEDVLSGLWATSDASELVNVMSTPCMRFLHLLVASTLSDTTNGPITRGNKRVTGADSSRDTPSKREMCTPYLPLND